MMRHAGTLAATLFLFSAAHSIAAEELDAKARQAAVAQVGDALRQRYVYPEIGAKLADEITANLRDGAYDTLSDPAQFAAHVKADLYAVAHDKHLNLEAPGSPQPVDLPPPPRNEAGVYRAGKLDGDVGYIEVVGFPSPSQFKPVIDRAMTSLTGSKSIIIDLRRNYGGSPASVAYLASFFLAPSTHIDDIVVRLPNTRDFTREVYNSQPTPVNFIGRPVVVLTSNLTFSGGEALAYDLQNLRAAMVVGETTGGGANPTEGMHLTSGLTLFIPTGREENPVTGSNWDGKGVSPDIPARAPEAFTVAMAHLGRPAIVDLDAVSTIHVYLPRSTPLPASETAIRRLISSMENDVSADDSISPEVSPGFIKTCPSYGTA